MAIQYSSKSAEADLRASLKGRVIAPGEAEFDQARSIFYGGFDRRPALIARVADAEDVARVVSLARESGLPLAVRSGGHSVAGHGVVQDGIVLDLADMRALQINFEDCTAWAETGLTAGAYTSAVGAHGLVTGFGDTASVGIGGITLGGGVGYLVRKYGLTIDDLLAADVVTADGKLLRVNAQTHPDLFWAIRGGGGNFGVATRFQYRLHELDSIVGGMLVLPATPDVIVHFMAEAEAAPDELSTIVNIMPAPPMPFLAPEHHGKLILMAMLVYAGDAENGARVLAPFRALATPLADMLRPMRYTELYPPEEAGGYHPVAASRTMFLDHVDRPVAETILEHIKASTGMLAVTQLRVLGGAMARVPVEATAFAHRASRIMTNVAAMYGDPGQKETHEAWAADFAAALQQGDQGAYVNFLGEDGKTRIQAAYPGQTWERLTAIKARYDPTNLFNSNHNIPAIKES
jgi:FAD/FMN-containing dehydrogenase